MHLYVPAGARVVEWWVGAALAVYGAFRQKNLPVVTSVLIFMPFVRIGSYMWGWIIYLVPGPPAGAQDGWYSAAYHVVLIGLVLEAAHTKEPTRDEVK
ncbi:hypothetical protein RF640_05030 [Kocuria sp. CPCC 205231]|uniref:hypothetical protein n=1 Tax=Kocuria sp. CPCC 205231 TaxID=3073551 RepID=UPI0034D463D0